MNKIKVDLDRFENKRDFHLYLKEQCQFPEYYGCTLDALYDCLSENNNFEFEIVESEKYETYLLSIMRLLRDVNCKYTVVEKDY